MQFFTNHFEVVAQKNETAKNIGTNQKLNFDEMIIQTQAIYAE